MLPPSIKISPALDQFAQGVDHAFGDGASGKHHPDRARRIEFFDEVRNIRGRRQTLGRKFRDRPGHPVVNDTTMSAAMKAARDIGSHPAKANHTQLHCQTSLFGTGSFPYIPYCNDPAQPVCGKGVRRGCEVDEFFKGIFDKAPDIIREAAQSPLGLASLIVLVLGVVGAFLFRNVAGKLKLAAFAMITGGLLGLFIFASNPKPPPNLPPPDKNSLEKTALGKQAAAKLAEGDRLNISGANDEARLAYYDAVSFYKQAGDHLGQANALLDLGVLEAKLGHNDPATEAIHEALFLYKQESNSLGQANALFQLGGLERMLGRSVQARNDFEQANGLYKLAGDRPRQALALVAIAMLEAGGDRNDEAREAYTAALALFKEDGNRAAQASVHSALGDLDRKLGHYIPARDSYNEAIELFVKERFRLGQAIALSGLGDLERIFGNYDQARTAYTDAITLFKEEDNRRGKAGALSGLGDLERSRGHDRTRARRL